MAPDRHPGINMHKLPVGGGFIGLVFAAGSALIFILGFPTLWYFVFLSAALGIAIALALRFFNTRRSERAKPLSILTACDKTVPPIPPNCPQRRDILRLLPRPVSA
jgi:hypothetical protein